MAQKKLVLIDGHALAYRMFFALPLDSFTTKSGEPTNATYGFVRTLLDLIFAANPPEYLAVSFDVGATFRDEWFSEYKGTRDKMPDELAHQIDRIKEVVQALNIPIMELDGYEADDVLGTIARQSKTFGVPVQIITGDRDLLQLVDDNTKVELPPRGNQPAEVFDETAVSAKYGVSPQQFVDWKALVGDVSDNIPGVKGIGEKTATKLLQDFGSLDNIYASLDSIKGANAKKLTEGRESAYLSQKLARIVTDAPITLDLPACLAQDFDPQPVLELFRSLEFRSLTAQFMEKVKERQEETAVSPPTEQPPATTTIIVQTEPQLQELVQKLNQANIISFDVETTSLNEVEAQLVGVCLAVEPGTGYYIPVGHLAQEAQSTAGQMSLFAATPTLAANQLPLQEVLAAIRPAMTNPTIPKAAHNAKYDYAILEKYGIAVSPITFDTMIGEWLSDPSSKHKGLKDLARHRLHIEMTEIDELIGKGKNQKSFAEVSIEQAAPYGAADADMTLRLVEPLQTEVREKGLEKILDLEMPLIPVLAAMEKAGIAVDVPFLRHMSQDLAARLQQLEIQIFEAAGEHFNINSTQQLSDILFKKLELPADRKQKTSSGHFSTSADVLEALQGNPKDTHDIIGKLLEYRELVKLKSTYVDALPEMVNKQTGRIHTSFNQTGAITGRIASSNPNLQNIPIRSDEGQKIRRAFVAQEGWVLFSADYSQVELRILAHICQDSALLEAFRTDQDIHRATAAAVYKVKPEEVSYNQRRVAKVVNFGLIYGMGAFRLSRDAGLTLAESENYIKEYFGRFPGIQRYLDETKARAKQKPYFVETLLGRRRYFPVFGQTSNANIQGQLRAEREAINHPVQGTAADIIKIAMIQLHKTLTQKYRARLLLQVHDELLLELPEEEVEEVQLLVIETMSNAYTLDVPLKVETSVGRNWLELK